MHPLETKENLLANLTIDLTNLTPEERWRVEHARLHVKHKGHEEMHAEMLLILLITMVAAQIALVKWKQYRFRSYQMATLTGLWLFPAAFCMYRFWWRFLLSWVLFSVVTLFIVFKASGRHISGSTPRFVYKWFLFLHTVSYVFGILSYIIVLSVLFGLNALLQSEVHAFIDVALLLLFYGVYYGVLGRDFAEICTDKMAAQIGYYNKDGLPGRVLEPNVCAVCGNELRRYATGQEIEKICRLNCTHVCHEFCIRGWCIVGKKNICPYCKEKVDLARTLQNPWQKPHLFYGQLLDWIRYLLAWQPLIICVVQGINYLLGLE